MIAGQMKGKFVPPLFFVAAVSVAVLLFGASPPHPEHRQILSLLIPVACALTALISIPFTKKRVTYYGVQVFCILCYLVTIFATGGRLNIELILLTVFLTELVLYEPYPLNLIEAGALVLVATLFRTLAISREGWGALSIINHDIPFLLAGATLTVLGSLMTKYRELAVDLTSTKNQLTESVVKLASANTAYQDYALGAGEKAAETERLRITRDIHDIVGYTLTNNMMLMEAALDLIKENALALPAIIETARSSAEDGLKQVRKAMYRLREQSGSFPVGLNAVARLVRTFEQATSIRIQCDFANMPLTISEEIDSAVYHTVQQGLINSFRHGKATKIHVEFWFDTRIVQVRVRDDGLGSDQFTEGIGLGGMRERIEKLGGTMRAGTVVDGFLIEATIPVRSGQDD